jgi:predicted nucleotidyltransferase
MKPLNFTAFKTDYEAIAKENIYKYIDSSEYKAFVYGSRARGNHYRFSDLDIGIIGENPLPVFVKGELEDKLYESRILLK